MLQRRNTYLFYSVIEEKLLFYFESRMKLSNEKNIKNILDYHNLWLRKIIENIINSLVTYHTAKKDLLFFLSLSSLPSAAFTYVVIRYSILRERFCGFRYSLAVRSYLLFCVALGT